MALPPLPDVFGNYAIRGIVEVLPPDPVSWLPSTSGWKLLFLLALLALGRTAWRHWRRWQRNRYRGVALSELHYYRDESLPGGVRLGGIAALLKATALQAFPRRDIASLSGESWLEWLDDSTDTPVFSDPSRTLLQETLYRVGAPPQATDLARLCQESAEWIRGHREPLDA